MELFNNNTTPSQTDTTIPRSSISAIDLMKGNTNKWPETVSTVSWVWWTPTAVQDTVSVAQEMRFLSVKYKVYSVIVIILLLIIYSPVQQAISQTLAKRKELHILDEKIQQTESNHKRYENEKKLFEDINTNKEAIVTCVNQSSRCDQLSENINSNLEAIKAYIQLWNLQRPKMKVDESKILRSINEYMLQKSILWWSRVFNGTVTSISISDPSIITEYNMMKVPVSLLVSFQKKEDLLTFLNNIENYIYYTPEEGNNGAILFRIEELKYDIVNYKTSQDVEVSLSAYAYNGI